MNTHVITFAPGHKNEVREFLGLLIPGVAMSYRVDSRGVWQIQSLLSAAQVAARLSQWASRGEQLVVRQMDAAEVNEIETFDDWQSGQMIAPFSPIAGLVAQTRKPVFRSSI